MTYTSNTFTDIYMYLFNIFLSVGGPCLPKPTVPSHYLRRGDLAHQMPSPVATLPVPRRQSLTPDLLSSCTNYLRDTAKIFGWLWWVVSEPAVQLCYGFQCYQPLIQDSWQKLYCWILTYSGRYGVIRDEFFRRDLFRIVTFLYSFWRIYVGGTFQIE